MHLRLLSSVCAVALGLAFAPAAWADDMPGVDDGSAVAVENSTAAVNNNENSVENEFEADDSFNRENKTEIDTTVEDALNHEIETEESFNTRRILQRRSLDHQTSRERSEDGRRGRRTLQYRN